LFLTAAKELGDRRLHVSASVAPDAQIYADWVHITPSDRYPTEGQLRLPGNLSGHMPSAPRARSRSWSWAYGYLL